MGLIPGSAQHWHILLNHFPFIGAIIAFGILLTSFYLNSEDLKRTSLVLFVIASLLMIPTYITGAATRWSIGNDPGISLDTITTHMDLAFYAFLFTLLTGWAAWLTLWQYRRFSQPRSYMVPAVTVLAVLAIWAMTRTGSVGGTVTRPDLKGEGAEAAAVDASGGVTNSIANSILEMASAWPALEAVHFAGMAVLFGVVVLIVARVLFGIASHVPFTAFHRLLPLGVFGFMANVITGMLFFVADSSRYTAMTNSFFPKMALIAIGGLAILYFTIFDKPWGLKAGEQAPMSSKLVAAATAAMWTGVIIYGRLLPYLEGG